MNLSRHTYNTRDEKSIDFVIGFVGWLVVNGILYVVTSALVVGLGQLDPNGSMTGTLVAVLSIATVCLPLLLNIGAIVLFAYTRHWIALGALAAFGTALLVAICVAIVVGALCFAALASYSSMGP